VMSTMFKMVQQHMVRFQPKQMKLDALTQLGSENMADNLCQRDM
jgi:hypothetical protein